MTSEEKLLLKDLCSRLPYGVKVKFYYYLIDEYEIIPLTAKLLSDTVSIGDIKPYLFPLSSITEEQKDELIRLIHTGQNDNNEFMRSLCRIEFYHKHHIDYRGLIEKSLAIDATGKNIY